MALDKEKFSKAKENLKMYSDDESVSIPTKKPAERKTRKRDTHKVYSFWADKEQIEVWKCYIEANPELVKSEDLGLKAITEYIKNHKLSGEDKQIYEMKLKQKGLDKSIYI